MNKRKVTSLLVLLFAIIIFLPSLICADRLSIQSSRTGNYRSSIIVNGLERTYLMHIPLSFDKTKQIPLLIALHGGGGSGIGMVALTLGGFNVLSEREGFIVVYPDGIENHWNDGRGLSRYRAQRENIDDVGFISTLIDHLIKKYNIDKKRIYVTGMSNGAIMSYRLACELVDKIAAIAPVAGLMPEKLPLHCSPSRPVSVLIINNVDDPMAPWKGGDFRFGRLRLGKGLSVSDAVDYWVTHNKCSSTPVVTHEPDEDSQDGTKVRKKVFGKSKDGTEVILYAIEGGGHTWPSGYQYLNERIIGKTSRDINANEVIWNFFKKHPMEKNRRNLGNFRTLKKGMSYDKMVAIVGEPDKDIGSGIHIYLFKMPDKSEVIVGGFVGGGLMYIKQKTSDGTYADIIEFGPGDYDFSLQHDGLKRTYKVYVPASYDKQAPTPVVLNFHGGFGNAQSAERQSGMSKSADRKGFILVYPEAVIGPLHESGMHYQHWNGGPRVDPSKSSDVDDVGFVSAMLDKLKKDFNIDSKRVYATGISNGGTMVYRLACQLSERIAAIAPVETNQLAIECSPNRPISIIHFHGLADRFVPYEGGIGPELPDDWKPIETTISQWVKHNGCPKTPKISYNKEGDVTFYTYGPGDKGTEVILCLIKEHGHTWPGKGIYIGAKVCGLNQEGLLCKKLQETFGSRNYDFSANDAMWNFFKKHSIK
jgi:polyhydroxybutyrate depolymerase